MTNPTPADRMALAVCRANGYPGPCHVSEICDTCRRSAAAVVRELAELVVPSVPLDRRYTTEEKWNARDDVRAEILAIAAELEVHHG